MASTPPAGTAPAGAVPPATAPGGSSLLTEPRAVIARGQLEPRQGDAGSPVALRPDEVLSDGLDGVISGPGRMDSIGARRATMEPLSPARYKVQFTASAELRDKLERLQALMRSGNAAIDLAGVIEAAVTEKLDKLESRRFGRTKAPRKTLAETDVAPSSRHVPAAVRRAVHDRDQGRCRYVDDQGRRCTARVVVEFHHRQTFALGGDHSPGDRVDPSWRSLRRGLARSNGSTARYPGRPVPAPPTPRSLRRSRRAASPPRGASRPRCPGP
jgi:hypothetical protein